MEYDVHEKVNDDNSLGHSNSETASGTENALSKKNGNGKRKRKRPRTKALRRTIREKIEIALCTSDSPIQDILETNMDCVHWELVEIFSIAGDSADTLQLVLKSNDLNHSSTVVYVDNLPDGCKVDSLKRWASTFGTVVFVHPIMVRKANPNKDSIKNGVSTSTKVSISPDCTGKFFQSAFIKFVDDQSSVDFIKQEEAAKKTTQVKKAAENNAENHPKKAKKEGEISGDLEIQLNQAIGTEVIDIEKPEVCVDNSSDVIKGESGNYSRRRKRKRRPSHGMGNILFKKSKTTTDAEKKIETEDDKSNGFENADPKRASVDISVAEKNHEIKDVEMEVGDGFTSVKNVPQLTVVTIDESLKKTFRDVGTDVPEEFYWAKLMTKTCTSTKAMQWQAKNCNPQATNDSTKSQLEKKNISSTLMGLTKKEWKRKRGRCRLMMRAAKLREEHEDLFHRIPEEDKLADV
ncbi:hypothetical protein DINM_020701 [Dirofilaria immitis]|nr:hypothetical protein [Dirofilaria immitis]